ncbi:hypothetical protein G7Y79_00042g078600 [Physcia stellaris]|nr:hypothetical protein G7Y79_00042g078600 [Physcia stellaris]
MNSDSEQPDNADSITQYFSKAPSVTESFVAKRTRDADKRKPVGSGYVPRPKTSTQLTSSQNKSMKPPKSKRTKPSDSQESNLLFENSAKLYEAQDFDDSDLKINPQSKTSTAKNPPISSSQTVSRSSSVAPTNSRFTSTLHDHFTKIVDEISDENRMKCNRCSNSYKYDTESRSQINHLKVDHDIIIESKKKIKKTVYTVKIEAAFSRQPELEKQRKSRLLDELQTQAIDKKVLEFLYMRWIISANSAFNQVENLDFRTFLQYVNSATNRKLPSSDKTIRVRALELYKEDQKRVRYILHNAMSDIHITCDAWSSPNHLNLYGIVSHFVNEDMQQQTLLLALKKVQKTHSGENLTQIVLQTLDDYEIRNNLSYFVMDNAKNNDTMLKTISNTFREQHGIDYDPVKHRLRCLDHIINLAVQAYLFGKHPDVEYRIVVNIRLAKKLNDELQMYRKLEPQEKLHNINTFILRTPQRVQRFLHFSKDIMPKRNQTTR